MSANPTRWHRLTTGMVKHPFWVIGALLIAALWPFANKALHIDDPLFVWTAVWIRQHPLDFFGFVVNWFGAPTPMAVANANPPLASYFLALAGTLFGWRETALHAAFLLPALAAAAGIYQLARLWCERPLTATAAAIFTPVFFISCTTLMCDVLMLAFCLWALVLWERGLSQDRLPWLLAAGLLAGLAVLTKYSALSFLPLLALLGAMRRRKAGFWLLGLAVPVVMLAAYELGTAALYGKGLFSLASQYATAQRFVFQGGLGAKLMIGLAFTGGCLLPVLFFAPLLWRSRTWLIGGILVFGLSLGALSCLKQLGPVDLAENGSHWGLLIQMAALAAAGAHLLLLTVADGWRRRDTVAIVLVCWILGTFVFAAVLNWTVSARSLLPIVPATTILLARRLASTPEASAVDFRRLWPIIPAAAVTLALATADFRLANSARDAALQIAVKYAPGGARLWFQGHWGFQYYMQNLGAQPVDFKNSALQPGDLLVMPFNNTNIAPPDPDDVVLLETLKLTPCSWASTMETSVGAGFYAADWGPLPFAFGPVTPERYLVFKIVKPVQLHSLRPTLRGASWKPDPAPSGGATRGN